MKKITEVAHVLLEPCLQEGCIAVDFTLGNGFDTAFFTQYPVAKIYAFEIQEEVMKKTMENVVDERITFVCDGHEQVQRYVSEKIDAGIFNFGYCPNGDKNCTTVLATSKKAVVDACAKLSRYGRLVLVLYPGHEQGKKEAEYFHSWCKTLDKHLYETASWRMENRNAPFIICIEKINEEDSDGKKSTL